MIRWQLAGLHPLPHQLAVFLAPNELGNLRRRHGGCRIVDSIANQLIAVRLRAHFVRRFRLHFLKHGVQISRCRGGERIPHGVQGNVPLGSRDRRRRVLCVGGESARSSTAEGDVAGLRALHLAMLQSFPRAGPSGRRGKGLETHSTAAGTAAGLQRRPSRFVHCTDTSPIMPRIAPLMRSSSRGQASATRCSSASPADPETVKSAALFAALCRRPLFFPAFNGGFESCGV